MPKPVNILFLCPGNSARSILAEAVLSRDGDGRFRAFSAGTNPLGEVHPLALELLATLGVPTRGLRSKGLQEFAGFGATAMDAVIDVSGESGREGLPALPGTPVFARWRIPDPAVVPWDEAASRTAFLETYLALHARISRLVGLPFPTLGREEIRSRIEEIDRTS
jgi:arsenate reductase